MIEYVIIIITMLVIYFVLVRNKTRPKTDWESLPTFDGYKANQKEKNVHEDELGCACIHCGNVDIKKKPLKDKIENPQQTKFYHSCSQCRIILWRSEL